MGTPLLHSLQVTASILHLIKMQFLLFAGAVLAGVSGFSFNRNDECPTVQDGVTAFEDHFGTQIPDGLCLEETTAPSKTLMTSLSGLRPPLAFRCRSLRRRTWRCWASVSPRGPTAPRWRTSTTSSRRSSDTILQMKRSP